MVGVQVGDDHRVDLDVVDERARSLANTPLPQSSSSRHLRLDQIAGAGAVGVLP